jgi:hypothetical protein
MADEPKAPIDALAFAKERQAKLETEHTNLQQQFARSQQFLNEIGGKIALIQGRIAENADTLKALEPAAAPPQEEPPK